MEIWAPLAGVLVGGVLSWWGTWTTTGRQIKAERSLRLAERRRLDILPVVSRLIGAADEMWAAERAVHLAVFSLGHAERQTSPFRDEWVAHYDAQRAESMGTHNDANRRARQAAAELAILSAELDSPARALVKASSMAASRAMPTPTSEEVAARAEARDALIAEARRLLEAG